jgi:hypothetical protein
MSPTASDNATTTTTTTNSIHSIAGIGVILGPDTGASTFPPSTTAPFPCYHKLLHPLAFLLSKEKFPCAQLIILRLFIVVSILRGDGRTSIPTSTTTLDSIIIFENRSRLVLRIGMRLALLRLLVDAIPSSSLGRMSMMIIIGIIH